MIMLHFANLALTAPLGIAAALVIPLLIFLALQAFHWGQDLAFRMRALFGPPQGTSFLASLVPGSVGGDPCALDHPFPIIWLAAFFTRASPADAPGWPFPGGNVEWCVLLGFLIITGSLLARGCPRARMRPLVASAEQLGLLARFSPSP